MPVKIDEDTMVATIDESDNIISAAFSGLTGSMPLLGDDEYFTRKETQGAIVIAGVGALAAGSYYGRKNQLAGEEPFMGIFL